MKGSASGKLTASAKLAYAGTWEMQVAYSELGGIRSRHVGDEDVHSEVRLYASGYRRPRRAPRVLGHCGRAACRPGRCAHCIASSLIPPEELSKESGASSRSPYPVSRCMGCGRTYTTTGPVQRCDPHIVSGRLGHSTVALTLNIYSTSAQADQEAADRSTALIA